MDAFQCEECGEVFATASALSEHNRSEHGGD